MQPFKAPEIELIVAAGAFLADHRHRDRRDRLRAAIDYRPKHLIGEASKIEELARAADRMLYAGFATTADMDYLRGLLCDCCAAVVGESERRRVPPNPALKFLPPPQLPGDDPRDRAVDKPARPAVDDPAVTAWRDRADVR